MDPERQRALLLQALDEIGTSVWLSKGEAGDYSICAWSTGAERLYGISRADALGKNYLELFVNPLEREQSAADCARILGGEPFRNFIAEDLDAQGSPTKRVLTNCCRVRDPETGEWLQAEIGIDIAGLEESEQQLRRIREVGLKQQDAERRMMLIDTLKQVTSAITSLSTASRGLDQVIAAISDGVAAVTGASAATTVWRASEASNSLRVEAPDSEADPSLDRDVEAAAAEWVYSRGTAVFLDETTRRSRLARSLKEATKALRSRPLALIPMTFGDRRVGVIVVVLPTAPAGGAVRWTSELRESLVLFAQQAAIAVVTAEQIDELRRQNEVVAENQERMTRDKLTDDFVHRVRHVAAPIVAYAHLLAEDIAELSPADQERLLPRVRGIESRATDFLDRVREIATGLEASRFPLRELIEGILREVRATQPEVKVRFTADAGASDVYGIRPFVVSAVENVITNATTAMDRRGNLSVTLRLSASAVTVRIKDSGPGIDADARERVWEKGYSTKGDGHGYGLWRTKDVLESMAGSVRIAQSGASGTTIEIVLPRASGSENAS